MRNQNEWGKLLKMVTNRPEYRVLQVFSCLGVGGAETWLIALLRYFGKIKGELPFGLRIDICLTGGRKGFFDDEAEALGARLFYTHYSRRNLPSFACQFRRVLGNGRYDAIHDHQDYTAGLHFLFGIGHLPPVRVAHVHNPLINLENYLTSDTRRLTAKVGRRLLARLATHIIGTSRQVVSEYGFDENIFGKVERGAVHCGFDVSRFRGDYLDDHHDICHEFGFGERAKILLFVGRLMPTASNGVNQKNPRFAIEVAKQCIRRNPRVRMLMAGSGEDMREQLQTELEELGLEDQILLIGNRSDIPRLMSGCDLLMFPSIGEGLGMVAVEAQAAGLRVLASDAIPRECEVVPGMVEFKPLDAGPSIWANEALRLIDLPKANSLLCNLAVKRSPFSIESSAASMLNIYTGLAHIPR